MLRSQTSHAVMSFIVAPAACTIAWMSSIAYLVSFATPPATSAGPPGAVKSTPWLPETLSSQWLPLPSQKAREDALAERERKVGPARNFYGDARGQRRRREAASESMGVFAVNV